MAGLPGVSKLETMFRSAVEAFNGGNFDKARELCEKIALKDRNCFPAFQMLGAIALHKGDAVTAAKHFTVTVRLQPKSFEAHVNLGLARQRLSDDVGAFESFHTATRLAPRNPDVFNLLGNCQVQCGRAAEAVDSYQTACGLAPRFAEFRYNLGKAYLAQNQYAEAQAAFLAALKLDPNHVGAHSNLAVTLMAEHRDDEARAHLDAALRRAANYAPALTNLGMLHQRHSRLDEAAECFAAALRSNPSSPEALTDLGSVYTAQYRLEEAVRLHEAALRVRPDNPEALTNLGHALHLLGDYEQAAQMHAAALQLRPNFAAAHTNLGLALEILGDVDGAIAAHHHAISLDPDLVSAWINLASGLLTAQRVDDAIGTFQTALAKSPGSAEAHNGLALALIKKGEIEAGLGEFRRAIGSDPAFAEAHFNLGNVLRDRGDIDGAVSAFADAVKHRPSYAKAHTNLIMAQHYSPSAGNQDFLASASAWASLCAPRQQAQVVARDRDTDRVLRIGYVSGDLCRHPLSYFLSGILFAHDPAAVSVTCYQTRNVVDDMTEHLKSAGHQWRDISLMPDDKALATILEDGIDVLVDLSGHTGFNRLGLFAKRAAPVQASWLGYFGTTGLETMDYVIADPFVVPEGEERFFVEKVWRLPHSYFCFASGDDISVQAPPAATSGLVTFGSFNNRTKISPETVELWADVLKAVPNSHLLLKTKQFDYAVERDSLLDQFAAQGVGAERIVLDGHSPRRQLLEAYHRVDIALDPMPYGGGTTTVEALWMGVPVVCLRGDRWVGRLGESLLNAVGVPELVAANRQDYVALASRLAGDLGGLASMRASMRERMEKSPLCDAVGFTRTLETAYRTMWRTWCASRN